VKKNKKKPITRRNRGLKRKKKPGQEPITSPLSLQKKKKKKKKKKRMQTWDKYSLEKKRVLPTTRRVENLIPGTQKRKSLKSCC